MSFFGADYAYPRRGIGSYANPHHTIAIRNIPTNIKQVMRLCRFYYLQDSLLSAIVDKMSEYPITQLLITEREGYDLSSIQRDKWDYLANVTLNLRQDMVDQNIDKYVFGVAIRYMYYPFIRYCKCKSCRKRFPIQTLDEIKANVRDVNGKFGLEVRGECPSCSTRGMTREFEVEDRKSEARSGMKLIRLSPTRMKLKYNPTSGQRIWYWRPPTRLRNSLLTGDRSIIDSTEMRVLEAVYKDQDIKINPDRLWVSLAPEFPDVWEGWGVPPIFRVLEDVYYYKVLRRANEALAQEHVAPARILSPASTGDISPQRTMNLSDWQNKLKRELLKLKYDPNHIILSPMPINIEQMGGNARVMMVASEMEAAARVIAAGVGCPVEMIWGGLNWSGASVSLRVLENHFINVREENVRFLKFIVPKIATYFRMTPVDVELADFKMADDVQHQANAINLMLQGFLDRKNVLGEMDYDPDEVFRNLTDEHSKLNQITMQDNVAAAHMNTVIQFMEQKAQILMALELQLTQEMAQAQHDRQRIKSIHDYANHLHQEGYVTPLEFEQSALVLQRIDPNLSMMILQKWQQDMPTVAALLAQRMMVQLPNQGVQPGMDAPMMNPELPPAMGMGMGEGEEADAEQLGAVEGMDMQPGAEGPYGDEEGGGGGGEEPVGAATGGGPLPDQKPPRREAGSV